MFERIPSEPLLREVFAHIGPSHAKNVAVFVAEVLGGPAAYTKDHGGHPHAVRQHMDRALTEPQRRRWFDLLLDCADEVGLPDDPEFRSALVSYVEWNSRLAVIDSQPGTQVSDSLAMPVWDWGPRKGPFQP